MVNFRIVYIETRSGIDSKHWVDRLQDFFVLRSLTLSGGEKERFFSCVDVLTPNVAVVPPWVLHRMFPKTQEVLGPTFQRMPTHNGVLLSTPGLLPPISDLKANSLSEGDESHLQFDQASDISNQILDREYHELYWGRFFTALVSKLEPGSNALMAVASNLFAADNEWINIAGVLGFCRVVNRLQSPSKLQ